MYEEMNNFWVKATLDWQRAAVGLALQTQQSQLQALNDWQSSLNGIYRDMWDRWICRFGGGVPID